MVKLCAGSAAFCGPPDSLRFSPSSTASVWAKSTLGRAGAAGAGFGAVLFELEKPVELETHFEVSSNMAVTASDHKRV